MKQNFQRQHKSHLMLLTEASKKRAKRRLIGSIFLLFLAMILLLEVTSKIKPIAINPKKIEINPQNHHEVNFVAADNSTIKSTASAITTKISPAPASEIFTDSNSPNTNINSKPIVKSSASATTINRATSSSKPIASAANSSEPSIKFIPKIVTDASVTKKALTPEEILNGAATEEVSQKVYFIQLVSSNSRSTIALAVKELAAHNIAAKIQKITHDGNTTYRLRVGPFSNQKSAAHALTNINEELDSEDQQ